MVFFAREAGPPFCSLRSVRLVVHLAEAINNSV